MPVIHPKTGGEADTALGPVHPANGFMSPLVSESGIAGMLGSETAPPFLRERGTIEICCVADFSRREALAQRSLPRGRGLAGWRSCIPSEIQAPAGEKEDICRFSIGLGGVRMRRSKDVPRPPVNEMVIYYSEL